MTEILVAGVAVLDFVFDVGEFPRSPEKYRAKGASIVGGGNAANSAVAIARLGGTARLASRIGDDPIADLIENGLLQESVDCTYVKRFADKRSSFSSIYIDDSGERQIMNFRDTGLSMDADWLQSSFPLSAKAALADTRWPDGAAVAMNKAREFGIPGIMDAEAPVMEAEAAINAASHVAFSAQGVAEFTGVDNVRKATLTADDKLEGRVIVTDGENGVYVADNGALQVHPAFEITPIDTLGAGDVWHGAFTLALAENVSETDAIRFASAAAAIKCTRPGGRDGAPSRDEVGKFLENHS